MPAYDAIVIGAGPAAQQAGLFLGRAKINTLLIGTPEKSDLAYGKSIENFFGQPDSPSGLSLLQNGLGHLKRAGVEVLPREIIDLKQTGGLFEATTDALETYPAKAIIIATGAFLPSAGIRGEKDFLGKGIHTCVACDGPFFKNKKVVVVGTGAHAAEEAIELRDHTDKVSIFSQGGKWEMSEALLGKLKEKGIMMEEKRITAVEGEGKVKRATLADKSVLELDGVFVAMGSAGAVTFSNKLGLIMENDYIVINRDGKTNIEGIWAAGAVTGGNHQIAKSAGEGCNAAVSVIKTLKGLADYKDQT